MFPRYQNIVGRWCPSGGSTGFTLVDRSPCRNHGALNSMDPPTDWVISGGKGALDFDGANDYVSGSGNNQAIRAWSFWVKPNATVNASSAFQAVFQTRLGTNLSWYIAFGAATGLLTNEYITIADTSGGVNYRAAVADGGSLPSTEWSHLAIVDTGSSHAIYVNGVSRSVTLNATSPGTPVFNALRIGCVDGDGAGPRGFYAGQLDDMILFNVSIAPSDIREIYRRGRGAGLFDERRRPIRSAINRRRRVLLTAGS